MLVVGRNQDVFGAAKQLCTRHQADDARVGAVVAVIAEHQVLARRYAQRRNVSQRGHARQQLYALVRAAHGFAEADSVDLAATGGTTFAAFQRGNIRRTLRNLKAVAEADAAR